MFNDEHPFRASELRNVDRKKNGEERYGDIDYKEIYLLDLGYNKFFTEHKVGVSLRFLIYISL